MAQTSLGPPASGHYMCIPVTMDDVANGETVTVEVALPPDMSFTVIGISHYAASVTSDPSLTVGTHASSNGILTALDLTADTVTYALPNGSLASSSRVALVPAAGASVNIKVTLIADAGDAAEGVLIGIWGYITGHTANIPLD